MTRFITPSQAKNEIFLTKELQNQIHTSRQDVLNILQGKDKRLLLIVGPCSIHNYDATLEYARRLSHLADTVKDTFLIVMRAYLEKPRSQYDWKGFIYDPHLNGSYNIETGIELSRKLLLELTNLKLPLATEFLDPLIAPYIQDFISWGSIGARTAESPLHRQLAATLNMPVGFKNRTDGNIDIAISGCLTAMQEHRYIGMDQNGQIALKHASGNPFAHLVLRGGSSGPNYEAVSIQQAIQKLQKVNLPPSSIVDCSHDNSKKNHRQQSAIFRSLITQITHSSSPIRGIMLESFLLEANQPVKSSQAILPDVSITDPCLDWESTKQLIEHEALRLTECISYV